VSVSVISLVESSTVHCRY